MDWNILTGISSVSIALCALAYTVWQGKQLQKHNKLSFRPHLHSWAHKNSNEGVYVIEIINNGLGPALIESFTIKVDGTIISGEGTEPIEKALKILFPDAKFKRSHQSYMAKDYAMAAKEKCTILAVQFDETSLLPQEVVEYTLNRADLVIKYKSFYDEDFIYSSEEKITDEI